MVKVERSGGLEKRTNISLSDRTHLCVSKRNYEDKAPILVGITGAVGSGKTTLTRNLVECISESGYVVHVVNEVVSEVVKSFAKKMRDKGYNVNNPVETIIKARECDDIAILEYYIIDRMYRRVMDALYNIGRYEDYTPPDVVITDRTHYDWLYFFIKYVFNRNLSDRLIDTMSKSLYIYSKFPIYNLVVICDFRDITDDYLRYDFPSKVRVPEDTKYIERKAQHVFISEIVKSYGVKYIYAKGDLPTRVRYTTQTIIDILDRFKKPEIG